MFTTFDNLIQGIASDLHSARHKLDDRQASYLWTLYVQPVQAPTQTPLSGNLRQQHNSQRLTESKRNEKKRNHQS